MPGRDTISARLEEPGVIAVVRAPRADLLPPLAEALWAGGIVAIEITLTVPDALGAIRATRARLGDRGIVGVGSVVDAGSARDALAAGAEFVVSPICRPELVSLAHAAGKPVMLGAGTATEAQTVHEAGADFVKVFPADVLGPAFIRALRAPLPHLRIVPTGGVDLDTLTAFVQAGSVAVGVGSSLTTKPILAAADWPALTRLAAQFVAAMRAARGR
jgi:2-dehydro-3-deoxyphosphogluconate aldolase/(4S)-4-hydroxy-2-oxoglutarate aldolase